MTATVADAGSIFLEAAPILKITPALIFSDRQPRIAA